MSPILSYPCVDLQTWLQNHSIYELFFFCFFLFFIFVFNFFSLPFCVSKPYISIFCYLFLCFKLYSSFVTCFLFRTRKRELLAENREKVPDKRWKWYGPFISSMQRGNVNIDALILLHLFNYYRFAWILMHLLTNKVIVSCCSRSIETMNKTSGTLCLIASSLFENHSDTVKWNTLTDGWRRKGSCLKEGIDREDVGLVTLGPVRRH
jgi:hypothetical protein